AALVRDATGRVLLVQRAHGQFGAGQWCIPCSYVEWGEDLRAAAAREALEEAGVAVEIGDVLQVTVNRHDPERPTVGIWFSARLLDATAEPCAGDDAGRWAGSIPPRRRHSRFRPTVPCWRRSPRARSDPAARWPSASDDHE